MCVGIKVVHDMRHAVRLRETSHAPLGPPTVIW